MFQKVSSLFVAFLLSWTAISPGPASAATKAEKQARFVDKVKAGVATLGVGPDTRVEVKLRGKSRLAGYIKEVREDSFVVANLETGESTAVAYAQVAQVKGQNLTTGQKIAIGVGIAVVVTIIIFVIVCKSSGYC